MNLNFRKTARVAATLSAATSLALVGLSGSAFAKAKPKPKPKPVPTATLKVEKPIKAANITEAGSSLLYPLWNLWTPAYQRSFHNINITPGAGGSGLGISEAASGTIQIGSSDAYLSPLQLQANPGLLNIPVAISSQMVVFNIPSVHTHINLNGQLLAKIYSGQITNWDDPAIAAVNKGNPLPNLTIVPLYRTDGSGDTFLFSTYLYDQKGWTIAPGTSISWPSNPALVGENGNGGMVSGCQAHPGCIAYVGASYLTSVLAGGLTYASLENGLGKYLPWNLAGVAAEAASFTKFVNNGAVSMIDAKAKNGYPIINYEYAIVKQKQSTAANASAVRSILEWAIDPMNGGKTSFLTQINFLPLPAAYVAGSYKLIRTIHS